MSDLVPPVSRWLMDATAVAALVSTRVYAHGSAPKGVDPAQHYITWSVISGTPENVLSELPTHDFFTIQVDGWVGDVPNAPAAAHALGKAIRDAVDPLADSSESVVIMMPDTDTKRLRASLRFSVFLER